MNLWRSTFDSQRIYPGLEREGALARRAAGRAGHLIISRALCDLFNAPSLNGKIAFRGGTAINKLLFKQPLRYSED